MKILSYIAIIIVGVLISEFIHYQNNENYYGKKPNGFKRSFFRWLDKRWNNLIISAGLSFIFMTLVYNGVNSDSITEWALHKVGEGDASLDVSGVTLTGIFAALSDWVGRKTGIVKPEIFTDNE
jgi:hypothetical protein